MKTISGRRFLTSLCLEEMRHKFEEVCCECENFVASKLVASYLPGFYRGWEDNFE